MFEAQVVIPVAGTAQPSAWRFAEQAVTVFGIRRDGSRRLPPGMAGQRGAYLLVSAIDADGAFDAYAGTAWAQRLARRVPHQLRDHPWAVQAFAIQRDTPGGLAENHARFLERALYDLLQVTPHCRVRNGVPPTPGPVTDIERRWLTACLDPLQSVAAIAGYELGHGASPLTAAVSIADLLRVGLLQPGERLLPGWTPAGVPAATITTDGNIRWRGREYSGGQPSIPARLARGGRRTNGWDYWKVRRGAQVVPIARLREQYRTATAA